MIVASVTSREKLREKYQPTLVRTRWGFYQYQPAPSPDELRALYAEKYYQEASGTYAISYTPEEVEYWRWKGWCVARKASTLTGAAAGTMLDVGCGEGWILHAFHERGWQVRGFDFSAHAIAKFHPHLVPSFTQGDIYDLLRAEVSDRRVWDVIVLGNVIEHVTDPVGLLEDLRHIMHERSVLVLIAPNDFSPLHQELLMGGAIDAPFWLAYPTHLSYFNRESMECLLHDLGYTIASVVADNPIDCNLLNENSNYIRDRSRGKQTHIFRVRYDNFLARIDREKLLTMRELLGSMGVGRDLTYYSRKRPT